ncbi:cell wall-associated hydrolase, invasion-associated protein [Thermanaerovibrio velox DSM 12556]|uniref:Cell wall-associated hydrolase, invasion-associated protein n=1 Tax=Thermanaerovibrio velox DSM 12556 TaxID=926567 RepID=H0UNK6_9BACT|nr:SH3 domain-containing C40 family peptidase [Thermanaerovibrio velox]EHM10421.1 cell wall-associated hydrolase, invasion-associated protein [Thermanaerovibrio velox DSM 12556]
MSQPQSRSLIHLIGVLALVLLLHPGRANADGVATRVIPDELQAALAEQFKARYFMPWSSKASSLNPKGEFQSWYRNILDSPLVGSNLLIADRSRKEAWVSLASQASEARTPGMALKRSDLRVLPTREPLFEPPGGSKTSFPFDRLQNGTVNPMEPLLVTAKVQGWLLVVTPWASGWLEEDSVALLDQDTVERIQGASLGVITKDGSSLAYQSGISAFTGDIGTLIPIDEDGAPLLPLWNPHEGRLELVKGRKSDSISPFPVPATSEALEALAKSFLHQPYGWGGLYGNRDCSSTTRDALIPFGIWLPRNSHGQGGMAGLDLSRLPRREKARLIVDRGIPFLSILYMRGHVMLYAGHQNGNPLVLHNLWSLKVNGREEVFGRCVLTDLNLGDVPLIDRVTRLVMPVESKGL